MKFPGAERAYCDQIVMSGSSQLDSASSLYEFEQQLTSLKSFLEMKVRSVHPGRRSLDHNLLGGSHGVFGCALPRLSTQYPKPENGTQSPPVLTIFFRRHDLSKCVADNAHAHLLSDVWWRMDHDGNMSQGFAV